MMRSDLLYVATTHFAKWVFTSQDGAFASHDDTIYSRYIKGLRTICSAGSHLATLY